MCCCVSRRPHDACVHPGLHVQPGGGGEDHYSAKPCQPHQQPGVHPGIRGQPAQDRIPSPTRVSVNAHEHARTISLVVKYTFVYLCCGWMCLFVCVSAQVKVFVTGLFSLNQDIPAFKEHLRDFLVQIKVRLSKSTSHV